MRTIILFVSVFMTFLTLHSQTADTLRHEVLLETDKGNIRIALYNETPLHRDNFIKLVKQGFYDGLLFHRVINRFMIQAGDSASRNAHPGQRLGYLPEGYSVPAEIRYPELLHKRGAVAAARESDDVNPEKKSSASQFYIVYGRRFSDSMLDDLQLKLDKHTGGKVKLTEAARSIYKQYGGTPHLDGAYTVFGEVVEGLETADKIQRAETDKYDRPIEDIRIIKAIIIK